MHRVRKGQLHRPARSTVAAADQFYSLGLVADKNPRATGTSSMLISNSRTMNC